jgi:alpha-galactosidase
MQLANDIGVPIEEINYLCAGINHMAFYLRFERNGQDLYPAIRQVLDQGRVPDWNRVRYEVFKRLGYFVTESSEHFSEYVPWFIKRDRPDLVERFNIPLDEYMRRCEVQLAGWEAVKEAIEAGPKFAVDPQTLEAKLRAAGASDWDVAWAINLATTSTPSSAPTNTAPRSSTAWRPASRA